MDLARIIVIDQDPTFLSLMEELLKGEGFEVTTSLDGGHAHALIAERQPALVILDIRLGQPGDGMRLIHQLEDDPRTAEIPVLICSADAQLLRLLDAQFPRGGHAIVEKPFDIDDLVGAVRNLLRQFSGVLREG